MLIHALPALRDNYIWAIAHPETRNCVIVDPGTAAPVLQFLQQQQLKLIAILITHHHWDHTAGIADLVTAFKSPVYGPAHDIVPGCDYRLTEGNIIHLSPIPLEFTILFIPGHTLGHIAYVGAGSVFCGDTLFAGGCGRLFEGKAAQLFASLQKLSQLPPATKVYCAHEYTVKNLQFAHQVEPDNQIISQRLAHVQSLRAQQQPSLPSTIEEELATNPFLRCHLQSVKKAAEEHCHCSLTSDVDVFAALRAWKDIF